MAVTTDQTLKNIEEGIKILAARQVLSDRAVESLLALYQLIWCEAVYDPMNDATKAFAAKLLPHIENLNRELKFKK